MFWASVCGSAEKQSFERRSKNAIMVMKDFTDYQDKLQEFFTQ